MDPRALEKANRRLRVAEESAAALATAPNYEAFADRWYVFLHAAKGIYTTLEQGAKATPQARQWFGAKNQERKADPLLRYITEARNDDEHGLEENTDVAPQSLTLGIRSPGSSALMRDQFGNTFAGNRGAAYRIDGGHPGMAGLPRLTALDGLPIKTAYSPPRIVMKPVRDRGGQTYDPPKSHMGNELQTDHPQEVSALAIAYFKRLLSEAAGFHTP